MSLAKSGEKQSGNKALIRWGLVALISLGTIINYLSRNTLAVLAPQLEAVLHFGVREYSYIVAAFQLAYTLMQPVCGFVLDRLGSRVGFALFALAWSAASLLHASANGWQALAVFRGGLGAAEAAAVPAGMKAISEWFSGADRSKAVGWFNVGTSLGAMLAPPLTVGLTLAYGWRSTFVVTAVMGILWAGLWFALYRSPSKAASGTMPATPARGLAILRKRRFWALAIPRFLAEPAWQTFTFWVPLYLVTERHWDLRHIALFAWMPFLAADLGGIAGGYLSPSLIRIFRLDLLSARMGAMWFGAVLMIAPGCVALASNAYVAIALLCVGGFAHQMISVTINTLSADLFASRELATANGWVGSAGWSGGLVFSLIIGQVVRSTGFGPLFACLGVFDLIGAVTLWILLRGVAPVEEVA
jgi:ACS family hexuronate transporter-like MFS transporter